MARLLFIPNLSINYCRDDMVAGQVYQLMLHFPPNIHVAVRHTAMVLAGDLAHWIAHHEEYIGLISFICFRLYLLHKCILDNAFL